MLDVLLLARSDFLLHSSATVAEAAIWFNPKLCNQSVHMGFVHNKRRPSWFEDHVVKDTTATMGTQLGDQSTRLNLALWTQSSRVGTMALLLFSSLVGTTRTIHLVDWLPDQVNQSVVPDVVFWAPRRRDGVDFFENSAGKRKNISTTLAGWVRSADTTPGYETLDKDGLFTYTPSSEPCTFSFCNSSAVKAGEMFLDPRWSVRPGTVANSTQPAPLLMEMLWETWTHENMTSAYMKANEMFPGFPYSDIILTSTKRALTPAPEIWWPLASRTIQPGLRKGFDLTSLVLPASQAKRNEMFESVPIEKIFFAAFLSKSRNCWHSIYRNDVLVRSIFVELLSEYKLVHSLGFCQRANMTRFVSYNKVKGDDLSGPYGSYKPYKFVVVMDNARETGWFTERLVTGYLANAIPIYFGAPDVEQYVNPERIINCDPGSEMIEELRRRNVSTVVQVEEAIKWGKDKFQQYFTNCIQRIIDIDKDDKLFLETIKKPFLLNNTADNTIFEVREIAERVRLVVDAYNHPVRSKILSKKTKTKAPGGTSIVDERLPESREKMPLKEIAPWFTSRHNELQAT
jgi:hypothetical protein